MARQGQGDENGNGNGNDGPPWFWFFDVIAVLYCLLLCLAELRQRLVERLPYFLLRIAEHWQRVVEVRQRSRKPGTLLVPTSQAAQTRLRAREDALFPLNENTDGDGIWDDIDISLAMETNPDDLVIPENIDQVDQLPEVQAPFQDIDINPVDQAEADLAPLLMQVATPQHRSTVLPAPEVDADDDAPIFETTPIDAPDLGAAVMDNTTQGSMSSILPHEAERHEASTVGFSDQGHETVEVHNLHEKRFLVNLGLQLLQAALIELCGFFKVSQDLLIPSAVQQALISAVKAVDSASGEVELAVLRGQDEANTARRPQVPGTSTSEEVLVPPDMVGDVAVRGSQHLSTGLQVPESVAADTPALEILEYEVSEHAIIPVDATEPEITGTDALEQDIGAAGNSAIAALDHPQQIERDEGSTNSLELDEVEDEAGEPSVQLLLQMASSDGDTGHDRVATPSLSIPAGDLNSHLEVQLPSAVTKGGGTEAEATVPEEI